MNGDFEDGLNGWHQIEGAAFSGQPIRAQDIRADQVRIEGKPPVRIGGDYWHLPYPVGQNGEYLIRTRSEYDGILESDPFTVAEPFLCYRLGGSALEGCAIELRIAAAEGLAIDALDAPDAQGMVAVLRQSPAGSDVLREYTWNVSRFSGAAAKIRLIAKTGGKGSLLADAIRLAAESPQPFTPPIWGWADIHTHPMAHAGFGGLVAGHLHGPVEDLGSCIGEHGVEHNNPVNSILNFVLWNGHANDGGQRQRGWPVLTRDQSGRLIEPTLEFSGWPTFDDITHIKMHRDWLHRAYEGGQRLMVALVVHNELMATLQGRAQSDRDAVEPQVRMLREFVVHNRSWCGIATTPQEARAIIAQDRLAFVLGLETDSVNGWVKDEQLWPGQTPPEDTEMDRRAIHDKIHRYFAYLYDAMHIRQINLIHLSDNAFGGMALYDVKFVLNTFFRRGGFPAAEDGYVDAQNAPRSEEEQICAPVTVESELWKRFSDALQAKGINLPQPKAIFPEGHGARNSHGLTLAGKVALDEAMRLGMIIDIDHLSERSTDDAFAIVKKHKSGRSYPMVSAHNGARFMAPRPLLPKVQQPADYRRRDAEMWPNEQQKSGSQLADIVSVGGMFGHGIAGKDARHHGPVANDCAGTSKTVAQGFHYVLDNMQGQPVALGSDWNVLLNGPGPRFGPRAAWGLIGEQPIKETIPGHQRTIGEEATLERRKQAADQMNAPGVAYATPLLSWRSHRFAGNGLYEGPAYEHMWQALALIGANVSVDVAALDEPISPEVRGLVAGMQGGGQPIDGDPDHYRAGQLLGASEVDLQKETPTVRELARLLQQADHLWSVMRAGQGAPIERSTVGKMREFDYNIDGLAHYGMLPDMLQDLKNVGFGDGAMQALFASAEKYVQVWETCTQLADPGGH